MDETTSFINVDPKIMLGKPVLKGTRITVELIVEKLLHGEMIEQILESYPSLNEEKIQAALQYAQTHDLNDWKTKQP